MLKKLFILVKQFSQLMENQLMQDIATFSIQHTTYSTEAPCQFLFKK